MCCEVGSDPEGFFFLFSLENQIESCAHKQTNNFSLVLHQNPTKMTDYIYQREHFLWSNISLLKLVRALLHVARLSELLWPLMMFNRGSCTARTSLRYNWHKSHPGCHGWWGWAGGQSLGFSMSYDPCRLTHLLKMQHVHLPAPG